jgi:hypothetical protein
MIAAAQPGDAPWAGLLGGHVSWAAYDGQRLAALQVYVGFVGPRSRAESAQKFVHVDLGFGEKPEGWPNQLENDTLVNLNYELPPQDLDWRGALRDARLGARPRGRRASGRG